MKTTKRLLTLLLAVIMVFSLACCRGNAGQNENAPAENQAGQAQSDFPLLWRVTDQGGNEMWLFGTIHVGNKKSKEVLNKLKPLLGRCDALAVEADVVAYEKQISRHANDILLFLCEGGTTVSDHMPKQLYDRAVSFLREAKMYQAAYDYLKPSFWSMLIDQAIIEKKTDLSTGKGMDTLLIKNANSENTEILEVESIDYQYSLLAGASDEYSIISIEAALDGVDTAAEDYKELYNAWLAGDEGKIIAASDTGELSKAQQQIVDEFNSELITKRNKNMAEKAAEYIKSGKTVFFAVGVLHFLGEDGIVALLKQEGYTVERVGAPE